MVYYSPALVLLMIGISESLTNVGHRVHPEVVIGEDERLPSDNPSVGRLRLSRRSYEFCTATLVGPSCAVTAGHCKRVAEILEFDLEHKPNTFTWAKPENTFEVDKAFFISENQGKGADWAVFRLKPNRKTTKRPGDDRPFYSLAQNPPEDGDRVLLSGYGASDTVYSFQQQSSRATIQTHNEQGVRLTWLEHDADTGSSSSGSALISESSGEIVGIHTHGDSERLINSATDLSQTPKIHKAVEECLTGENSAGGHD